MGCGCKKNPDEPFHRGEYLDFWNREFDRLPKYLQDEILRDPTGEAAHQFNKMIAKKRQPMMKRNPMKRRKSILQQIQELNRDIIADKHEAKALEARERADLYAAQGKEWERKTALEIAKKEERLARSFRRKSNPVKRKKMASPWRFVKGAKPGFRKLKNLRTGKVKLIRMSARRRSRRNPAHRGSIEQEIEEIRKQIKHAERMINTASTLEEAELWKNTQSDLQQDLDEALTEKELRQRSNPITVRRRSRRNPRRETLYISRTLTGDTFLVKDSRGALVGRFNSLEEAQRWVIENGYRMGYRNPITVRRLPHSSRYRVTGPHGVHAQGTTLARAKRQASLLRAVEHGRWRPTGAPARSVQKKLRTLKRGRVGQQLFAHRKGRKWTIRTKARGGHVIAKGLSLGHVRTRARKLGYKVRSL